MPDAEDLGFELLPPDDEGVEPEAEVEAAAASVLEDVEGEPIADDEEPPQPFGRTWLFDFERGRFRRDGAAPAEVRGFAALEMWCLMALHSARYAHAVFSDDFGMERPEEPLGELLDDEAAAEYAERAQEALLVHDRIAAVENFEATIDPRVGALAVEHFEIVTDDDERLVFDDVTINVGEV